MNIYVPPAYRETRSQKIVRWFWIMSGCFAVVILLIGLMWLAQAVHDNGGFS